MYREYPYLIDGYYQTMNSQLTKKEFLKKIDELTVNHQYVKITLLDVNENPIKDITGEITGGSLSVDGTSAARRTASLSCSVSTTAEALDPKDDSLQPIEKLKQYFSIDKKIFLEIGIRNDIDEKPWTAKEYPVLWFPQGIFFITDFSISSSTNSALTFSISLKDKMCKLNGEAGGIFPSYTKLDTYYDYGEANAVAESMSKKTEIKGSSDFYVMNDSISWSNDNWTTIEDDYYIVSKKSGTLKGTFTIPSNKYLQFEVFVNGTNSDRLSFEITTANNVVVKEKTSICGKNSDNEYLSDEYEDLDYTSYSFYLEPETYTLSFSYEYVEDDTLEGNIEQFAAIHMLNADQKDGSTFMQDLNTKNPIYNIISEIVHHFGGEDIDRIVIEDVDVYTKTKLKWNQNDDEDSLYIITNIKDNDPILQLGNRVLSMANDKNQSIPGTNYERKYEITDTEGLLEYDKQPDDMSNNIALFTSSDMQKILLAKWGEYLASNDNSINLNIANADTWEMIDSINDMYADFTTSNKKVEDYLEYIYNNGNMGTAIRHFAKFGGYKPLLDLNTAYIAAEGNASDIFPELDHTGTVCYIDKNEYVFILTDTAVYFHKFKENEYTLDSEYNIEEYQYNDDIGYAQTYLYYNGDLTANAGETVSSVLDKIVSQLGGNFEYFYDTFGNFRFREKKNYLNNSFSSAIITDIETANNFLIDTSLYYLTDTCQSENVYTFSSKNNITSLSNNPNYSSIKNDFILSNAGSSSNSSTYYYHVAIDEKPQINQEGYDNVLVYQDPMIDSTTRDVQYDLAFPIFIDSPKGPQGQGNSNIYGYVDKDTEVKIQLNEPNIGKDYTKSIVIDETVKEDETDSGEDSSGENSKDDSSYVSGYTKTEDYYYALTFLQLLYNSGGDNASHSYSSDSSITKATIGGLLYYLYEVIDSDGTKVHHLAHSKTKKTLTFNKGKKDKNGKSKEYKKKIYKNDTASNCKDDLSYDSSFLGTYLGSKDTSKTKNGFKHSKTARFKSYSSTYSSFGKTSSARKKKADSLINEILYDNYLYENKGEGAWKINSVSSFSFIELYIKMMDGLAQDYEAARSNLEKKANGKNDKTDYYYHKYLGAYLTGGSKITKWWNTTDTSVRDKKAAAYRKKLQKQTVKVKSSSGKTVEKKKWTTKQIDAKVKKYVDKHKTVTTKRRFKEKGKGYWPIIKALYRSLLKIWSLSTTTSPSGKISNMVSLDDKYYYCNGSKAAMNKNKPLIRKLLWCLWKPAKCTTKTKHKNKKTYNFLKKNKNSAYKYVSNFYDSKISVLSKTVTLERHKGYTESSPGYAEKIISTAREHIGCRRVNGSVKDVPGHKTKYICADSTPWCGLFVAHVFKEAGLEKYIKAASGNYAWVGQYRETLPTKGRSYSPKMGDLVLFGNDAHIAIVIADNGSTLHTIDGNSTNSSVVEHSARLKSDVECYVPLNLPRYKKVKKYKKKKEKVTYSLFSLFRKTFYNELNNNIYNYKKPNQCDLLRHRMRVYFDYLYYKYYALNKKKIYTKCKNMGEQNASKKSTTVNNTPTVENVSALGVESVDEKGTATSFSLTLNYLSGKTWKEWVESSYNAANAYLSEFQNSDTLKDEYVFINSDGSKYWLGNDSGKIVRASDYISSTVSYKWYKSTVVPKEEAESGGAMTAPNLEYNVYTCCYKGLESVKFWYYNTIGSEWQELEDWVCYYNDDKDKRYVNIDFSENSTNAYTGLTEAKYLPNLTFMKINGDWDENTNTYSYSYPIDEAPSQCINSKWYRDTTPSSRSPIILDENEYSIDSDDNRLNLSRYIAKEWRTEIILQGLLSYEQYSIEASSYYPELKAWWPTTYNLKNQCFYGQEEQNRLYHTSLTTGNYFLDLIDPNETSVGDLSITNIGRRQSVTTNSSINCLFAPQPHDYYFIKSSALDYFDQRDRIINQGGTFITVSADFWDKYIAVGNTTIDAYSIIKDTLTTATNYKNSVQISSIPVLYLDPNLRISIEDSTTNTYGDYVINNFSINFSGTPSMSTSCTKAIVKY